MFASIGMTHRKIIGTQDFASLGIHTERIFGFGITILRTCGLLVFQRDYRVGGSSFESLNAYGQNSDNRRSDASD
jgi:hypothetical protein